MRFILIFVLIFIPLFLFRHSTSQPTFEPGNRIRITTRLAQEPAIFNNKLLINVSNVRVFAPRFPEYHYGDKVRITGIIQEGKKGLLLAEPAIELIEKRSFLPDFRRQMIDFFNRSLPMPQSALVAGITLGAKETLPQDFKESLIKAGLLHIVVASGMNVTIVARFLIITLILFLSRPKALFVALSGIWGYVFLIGPDAPIIRAAIMGSLAFIAQETGRIYWAWWGLILSGFLMLFIWPSWISDVGFLLSFTATAGILAFEKPLRGYFSGKFRQVPAIFRDNFAISIAAQAAISPILWFSFGQFSPWSPLVNGAVLWTIGPLMSIASLGVIIGLIIDGVGRAIILLTYPLAFYFTTIVSLF